MQNDLYCKINFHMNLITKTSRSQAQPAFSGARVCQNVKVFIHLSINGSLSKFEFEMMQNSSNGML